MAERCGTNAAVSGKIDVDDVIAGTFAVSDNDPQPMFYGTERTSIAPKEQERAQRSNGAGAIEPAKNNPARGAMGRCLVVE